MPVVQRIRCQAQRYSGSPFLSSVVFVWLTGAKWIRRGEPFGATLFGVAGKTLSPARTDGRAFPASAPGVATLVLSGAARAAGARASANRPSVSARARDGHPRRHGNRPARATA